MKICAVFSNLKCQGHVGQGSGDHADLQTVKKHYLKHGCPKLLYWACITFIPLKPEEGLFTPQP